MFFNISNTHLENYPCHWRIGDFFISTDTGWNYTAVGTSEVLYKGYADANSLYNLLDQIIAQHEPCLTGNFCALVVNNGKMHIKSDRYRSFPIYLGNGANNLIPTGSTAWSDSLVTINEDWSITEAKFDLIGEICTDPMTSTEVLCAVEEIINEKTKLLLKHNQLPIRAFLSGGVDSLLVYSFLRKHTDQFELVKYSHVDYDYFWLKNSGDITKYWGYTQIHHWIESCVLTSGTPGDEFMLRSPTTTDLFFKYHNIEIAKLLSQPEWKTCLHYDYFSRNKNMNIFTSQQVTSTSLKDLYWELCNIVVNDYQHWHLGNTLTWTPLRDLEIFKIMLRMPVDDILDQAMNSSFSIQLIEKNCPGLAAATSDRKNSGNILANLVNVI